MSEKKKRPHSITFTGPSRTLKDPAKDCDLGSIIKRFHKQYGVNLEDVYKDYKGGFYGDFSHISDYQSALDQVAQAQESFMSLPADVRRRFENDPAQFIEFVDNPDNYQQLVEMGLAPVLREAEKPVQKPVEPAKVKEVL